MFGSEKQEDDDEDINIPLKPSKRCSKSKSNSSTLNGTALTVCLGTFTVLFGAFVAFGATYTTAQSAWAADAFGGAFTSSQVAADRRQQSADWVKITTTSRKQREPHALTEAQTEIEQLKRELKQVESSQKAMHEGERAGTRGSKQSNDQEKTKRRNKDGWRDRWGHDDDYAAEVARKEHEEEENIKQKLAKDDTDSEKVEEAGLDKAHVKSLKMQKAALSRQHEMAKKLGAIDYRRREKEVDSLMPDDADCPGPACLINSGPHSHGPTSIKILHTHAPWQKHYPSEMANVMKSTPWVKVSGMTDFERQKAEADAIVPYSSGSTSISRGKNGGGHGRARRAESSRESKASSKKD